MTTPIVLTGGETVFGTAIDNTGTDDFLVGGAANTIVEGGGNLIVNGADLPNGVGWDTATTIYLGQAYQVNDQITLDGASNFISGGYLYESTVNVAVTGFGLAAAQQGKNIISLNNEFGNTNVSLTGKSNKVTLNSDATNNIATGGGYATVSVGVGGDLNFFYTTNIKLTGGFNTVTTGDQNSNIRGGGANNTITMGDGNNIVTLAGQFNTITAWGGTNVITAGKGNDKVTFLGSNGTDGPAFVYDPQIPIGGPPTDTVTLAGADNTVTATYENMMINGSAGTGGSTLNFGNGNNGITLGGNTNSVLVGNGANGIFLTGNANIVTVTDGAGVGFDNVTLGNGSGNAVNFDFAGGSVNATSLGVNTVTQAAAAFTVVNVDLNSGTGLISLGNGSDAITANGVGSVISAGNGNDTVNANGGAVSVTLGNGNDLVNANGNTSSVTVGSGNDTINANGLNATVVAGAGSDTINILGYGSTATVTAAATSHDSINLGSNDALRISSGVDAITGTAGNTIYANALQANSTTELSGNNNMVFLGTDSSTNLLLNQAQTGDNITIQADAGNTYGGTVDISYFNQHDMMDLQGLVGGITGTAINSYASVLENITAGPFNDTLHLAGGGAIVFSAVTGFTSSEFTFSSHTGPV